MPKNQKRLFSVFPVTQRAGEQGRGGCPLPSVQKPNPTPYMGVGLSGMGGTAALSKGGATFDPQGRDQKFSSGGDRGGKKGKKFRKFQKTAKKIEFCR